MSGKLPSVQMVRQPVFDDSLKVVAYNLLYKDGEETEEQLFGDNDLAVQLLLDEYTSIYESGEVKALPAYITVPEATIQPGWVPQFASDNVVLDLKKPNGCAKDYVAAVRGLVDAGYKVSLGGYGAHAEMNDLLDIAHTVKLDVNHFDTAQLEKNLDVLKRRGNISVLAWNIETVDTLENCVELGFDLFQGHFLTKPKQLNEGKLGANQAAVLQLLGEIQKPDVTPESIEEIVQMDPVLTFKLLKIVNSAAYSLVREVTSIADAIVLLGMDQVRQLAMIVGMSGQSDKPAEMYRSLLLRAAMCEQVAKTMNYDNRSSYFLAGVMSGLHLIFDTTQENLIGQISVAREIEEAVTKHEGTIGSVLSDAASYESGAWDQLSEGVDTEVYDDAYLKSMRWLNSVLETAS